MSEEQAQAGAIASARALAEEYASAAIQGVAALASVAGLAFLLVRAGPGAAALTGVTVYGVSLIVAFLASALYHGIWQGRLKRIFRAVDHCTIFILIAGTYTPITLLALWRHTGWLLLAAIWTLALLGAGLRLVMGPSLRRIAITGNLAMGEAALA